MYMGVMQRCQKKVVSTCELNRVSFSLTDSLPVELHLRREIDIVQRFGLLDIELLATVRAVIPRALVQRPGAGSRRRRRHTSAFDAVAL